MQIPFERAVREHGATVLRVCRAVLGRGSDADDAWSETFLAALRAWDGLADGTNVEAWLVRIAQRKAIDVTRARTRHAVPTAEPRASDSVDPTDVEPNDVDHDVWHEVAKLPERQRLALAYHYLGGLTHVETAEVIGGTPDAVRRAAADGIKTLRRTYAPKAAKL